MDTTDTVRAPRRLARPSEGRWLGGVAAALGDYFDLSPTIYRVAFVALALAGGTGVLLYVAAWLVIPDAREESSVAERMLRDHADRPSKAIGLALIAFVAILALSTARFWPGPGNLWLAAAIAVAAFVWWQTSPRGAAARPRDGEDGAAAVRRRSAFAIGVGALLTAAGVIALLDGTGAWHVDWRIALGALVVLTGAVVATGAAAGMRVGGVVVLGVVLLAALAATLAVRVPIFDGWGDRSVHPTSVAQLHSTYEHGIGHFQVDLRDVSLPVGETHVKVRLGVGDLLVQVPWNATVRVDAHATAGDLRLFGRDESGGSVDDHATVGDSARVLVLDSRIGFGVIRVVRG